MDGGGGARQVVDPVHLDVERPGDVVAHELEQRVADEVGDVLPAGGEEVVDAQDLVSPRQQPLAQVRSDEPGAAGDQYPFHRSPSLR